MRVLLSISVFLLVQPLEAKEAFVQSGSHSTFSRLVVYTGNTLDWNLLRKSRVVEIRSDSWASGFNLSSVFDKIDRSRITSITNESSGIILNLACDCDVEVSQLKNTGIIIDVIDPKGSFVSKPKLNNVMLSLSDYFSKTSELKIDRKIVINPTQIEKKGIGDKARDMFARSGRITRSDESDKENKLGLDQDAQLSQTDCPRTSFVNISTWAGNKAFYEQTRANRRNIVADSGDIQEQEIIKIAKLYVAFMMLEEAKMLLTKYGLQNEEAITLVEIIKIIDGNLSNHPGFQGHPTSCPGDTTVWRILSTSNLHILSRNEISTIYETFLRWPAEVRKNLSNRLGGKISASSQEAGNIILRTTQKLNPQEQSFGEIDTSDAVSSLLPRSRLEDYEVQISEWLNAWKISRRPLSAIEIDLINSLILQFSNYEIGDELQQIVLLNMLLEGEYSLALNQIVPREQERKKQVIDYIFDDPNLLENSAKILLLSNALIAEGALDILSDTQLNSLANAQKEIGFSFESQSDISEAPNMVSQYSPDLSTVKEPKTKESSRASTPKNLTSAYAQTLRNSKKLRAQIQSEINPN